MIFDKNWFIKHQRKLLWFANTHYGRDVLGISSGKSAVDNHRIIKILPNSITWVEEVLTEKTVLVSTEFRSHDKFSKRLFYSYKYIWDAFHKWDILFANNFNPRLNLGFDTLTAFPAAGANSPVDGVIYRSGVDESFATIRAATGTSPSPTAAAGGLYLRGSTTSAQYQTLSPHFHLFDTSALTSFAVISSAVYSACGTTTGDIGGKANALGSPDLHAGSSNPASSSTLVNGDYSTRGATTFGNVAYASVSTSAYNDITLNASGLLNISKTAISKFSMQVSWDILNSFTGVWASNAIGGFDLLFADTAGTSSDPKIVVTYIIVTEDIIVPTSGVSIGRGYKVTAY